MKYHLARIKGQISPCLNVSEDVCALFKNLLKEADEKRKENDLAKRLVSLGDDTTEIEKEEEQTNEDVSGSVKNALVENKGKRKAIVVCDKKVVKKLVASSQPSIMSTVAAKDAVNRADMVVARWFYDACIPFKAIFSPYYKLALNVIARIDGGYKGSSYHDLRVNILGDCKKEFGLLRDSYRSKWASSGSTVMVNGWTDQRQRTLIDLLVYFPTCMSFVKSVDASNMVKDASTLCNFLFDVAECVGPANVNACSNGQCNQLCSSWKKVAGEV